jgi:membrane protease YdiL (CAAX protease family)
LPPSGRLYRTAWVFYLVLAIAGGLWIGSRVGVIPLRLFIDLGQAWIDIPLGIAAGLTLLGLWALGLRLFAPARELEGLLAHLLGTLTGSEALALALLSGFAEELFFRGAVQGAIGWLPATVLFALLHGGPGRSFRLWTLFAGLAGALFGGLVLWRGSLCAAIVAHMVVNGVNLVRITRQPVTPAGSDEGAFPSPPDSGGSLLFSFDPVR